MPSVPLHLTLVQHNIVWEDKEANMRAYEQYFEKLPKQRHIVLLPEMCTTGFSMQPERLAEPMDGPTVQWLRNMSATHRCIIAGSFIIEEEGAYYNRLIWMQPDGRHFHYDKRHLFAYAGEDEHYTRGEDRLIVQVNGWRICPLVCYDLRFPVWSRNKGGHAGPDLMGDVKTSHGDSNKGNNTSPHPSTPPIGEGTAEELKSASHAIHRSNGNFYATADPKTYGLLKQFVSEDRKNPTKAEEILWDKLRGEQLDGHSFRRQHIIGSYIADFVCLAKMLIIEVDGLYHQLPEQKTTDADRSAWLETQGFRVLRFSNEEVLDDIDQVKKRISEALTAYDKKSPEGTVYTDTKPKTDKQSARQEALYDILIYVANWPNRRSLAWKTLLQARAIENQAYVVGLNRVGTDGKDIYYSGDSAVISPMGEILWQQADEEALYTITLNKEDLDQVRADLPFLRDSDEFMLL